MKTPEQLLADWNISQGAGVKCDYITRVTLIEAAMQTSADNIREKVMASLDEGLDCPSCDQYARRYTRKLNSGMARALIMFFRLSHDPKYVIANGWIGVGRDHMTKDMLMTLHQNEFHKLRWWGLIEQQYDDRIEGHRSEFWRLTELGSLFTLSNASVPARALDYNKECEGLVGESITIQEALGARFDYQELMQQEGLADKIPLDFIPYVEPVIDDMEETDPWGQLSTIGKKPDWMK